MLHMVPVKFYTRMSPLKCIIFFNKFIYTHTFSSYILSCKWNFESIYVDRLDATESLFYSLRYLRYQWHQLFHKIPVT